MAKAAAVFTTQSDSALAGRELGERVRAELADGPPDALVVFASARFDYVQLLTAIQETCQPAILVGSSSAGEFTGDQHGEGNASALAIWAPDMQFSAGLGRGWVRIARRPRAMSSPRSPECIATTTRTARRWS